MDAFVNRCCWLALCPECHREIQSCVGMAKQLVWKLLQDPAYFDLILFHQIWGRPTSAVTADEVLEEARGVLVKRTQTTY